jgi:manganese efflux pump family protein
MGLITLILLAFGLSADAFAVSVTNGMCSDRVTKRHAVATGFTFGFFQALMPMLGFTLGKTFSDFVFRYQHWIALLLLGAIGVNMLSDTYKEWKDPENACTNRNLFKVKNLIMQGIATSIDALAAGVSIAVLNINILSAALLIGMITFVLCTIGVFIGKKFGTLLGLRAKLIGGITLIAIGLKIFIENQFL